MLTDALELMAQHVLQIRRDFLLAAHCLLARAARARIGPSGLFTLKAKHVGPPRSSSLAALDAVHEPIISQKLARVNPVQIDRGRRWIRCGRASDLGAA
jgi:hypothetical protein